jgi:tRNA threonylcarbamoyladenosine biosynthesis protein TsaB
MNTLAIDTATTALGLCLASDSETRPDDSRPDQPVPGGKAPHLRSIIYQIGLKHSEQLMPAVRALLREAALSPRELDVIVCSTGPGSFTGIRIGLATAKGLADGVRASGAGAADASTEGMRPAAGHAGGGCRLIGVSTLDGLAYRYRRFSGPVVAVNPSLRKKYYAGIYRAGKLEGEYLETTLPDLCTALNKRRPLVITGAAAGQLYELMLAEGAEAAPGQVVDGSGQSCDPAGLLACGVAKLGEPEVEPVPLYLRRSEAEITFFGE